MFKKAFIIVFIFVHFDFNKKIWLKTNVFNYIIITILSQIKDDEIFKLITFLFKKMFLIEYNYDIYNKKLMIIIRVFEK